MVDSGVYRVSSGQSIVHKPQRLSQPATCRGARPPAVTTIATAAAFGAAGRASAKSGLGVMVLEQVRRWGRLDAYGRA